MSESTEQTTNNETTETKSTYEAVEYVHGANIKFPDGREFGFFANSKPGLKDGVERAKQVVDGLNELDYEGLQTMRTLACNIYAAVSGLPVERESPRHMNFISREFKEMLNGKH